MVLRRYELHEPVRALGRAMLILDRLQAAALADSDEVPKADFDALKISAVLAEASFDNLKKYRDKELLKR